MINEIKMMTPQVMRVKEFRKKMDVTEWNDWTTKTDFVSRKQLHSFFTDARKIVNKTIFEDFLMKYRGNTINKSKYMVIPQKTRNNTEHLLVISDIPNSKKHTKINIYLSIDYEIKYISYENNNPIASFHPDSNDAYNYLVNNRKEEGFEIDERCFDEQFAYLGYFKPTERIKMSKDIATAFYTWTQIGSELFINVDIKDLGGEFTFIDEKGDEHDHLDKFDVLIRNGHIRDLCMGHPITDKQRTGKAVQQLMKMHRNPKKNVDVGLVNEGQETNSMNLKKVIIEWGKLRDSKKSKYPIDDYLDNIHKNFKS